MPHNGCVGGASASFWHDNEQLSTCCAVVSTAHFPLLPSTVWLLQRRSIRRKIVQVPLRFGIGEWALGKTETEQRQTYHPRMRAPSNYIRYLPSGVSLAVLHSFGLAACIHVCSGLRTARSGLTSHFAPFSTSRVKPQIFEIFLVFCRVLTQSVHGSA